MNKLSRSSEVGSPTNHFGSTQRRDTGQGSFSPLTGGLDLTADYIKLKNKDRLWTCFTKAGWTWHVTICIPLQNDVHLFNVAEYCLSDKKDKSVHAHYFL